MITGYNTDVRHGNRVFHVQTEDKGMSNPKIETLIYVGGEILDSYRSSYEDMLLAPPVSESTIQQRMDEQHKAIIRHIKTGKYDTTPPDLTEADVFSERGLDQAILEYLQQEGDVDVMELVVDQPLKPRFGASFQFDVKARHCHSQAPVVGAEVSIRLISSLKKAVPLLSGKTNQDGEFSGTVELPQSQPGQCTVVISCTSDSGCDELRALITV